MSNQHDTPARITGLLVFLAGVGLLVFVFLTANTLFNAPAPPAPAPAPVATGEQGGNAASAGVEIGRSFSQLLQKILLLLLMCVAGSVIASKGIQLYFAARPAGATPPVSAAHETAAPVVPAARESAPPSPRTNGQGLPAPPASAEPTPAPEPQKKTGPV